MTTKERMKYQSTFRADKYDTVTLYLPKGEKEKLKDKAGGKSLSSYLNERLTKSVEVLLVDGVFPHCRVCGGKIQHLMYGKALNYCPFCGRGLDWSSTDKE